MLPGSDPAREGDRHESKGRRSERSFEHSDGRMFRQEDQQKRRQWQDCGMELLFISCTFRGLAAQSLAPDVMVEGLWRDPVVFSVGQS